MEIELRTKKFPKYCSLIFMTKKWFPFVLILFIWYGNFILNEWTLISRNFKRRNADSTFLRNMPMNFLFLDEQEIELVMSRISVLCRDNSSACLYKSNVRRIFSYLYIRKPLSLLYSLIGTWYYSYILAFCVKIGREIIFIFISFRRKN